MGSEKLIEALRAEAQTRAEDIRQNSAEKARALLIEAEQQAEALLRLKKQEAASAAEARRKIAEAEAARLGRTELSGAEAKLAERLYQAASAELALMRTRYLYREEHLAALIKELPGPRDSWKRISVHPADLHAACALMPQAEVLAEEGITGGLRAQSDDGRVVVDNTLQMRLRRAWPEMLTGLMKEIYARKP